MLIREVLESEKEKFDQVVNHPLQSWAWGEFRQKTGIKVIRLGKFDDQKLIAGYQVTIHRLPFSSYSVGYFPKGPLPDKLIIDSLKKIGRAENCLFIKLEPNVVYHPQTDKFLIDNGCRLGRPLFTKYTFQIDLTQTEEQLLAKMKEKTRYNIRLAQKYGVKIEENNTSGAFEEYLRLTRETTKRQKFYAHGERYHRLMWETLRLRSGQALQDKPSGQALTAHLLTATFKKKIIVTWILFNFNSVVYYPYGASSLEYREAMASNLMMWEAMKWGKAHGAKMFDLWGALGPNPDPKDAWFGFHRFKEGYGANLVEFIGSYDLIINPYFYPFYTLADNLRWRYLKLRSYIPI